MIPNFSWTTSLKLSVDRDALIFTYVIFRGVRLSGLFISFFFILKVVAAMLFGG